MVGKLIGFMLENYELGKQSYTGKPQTFTFHMVPQFVFLVENSAAYFTQMYKYLATTPSVNSCFLRQKLKL